MNLFSLLGMEICIFYFVVFRNFNCVCNILTIESLCYFMTYYSYYFERKAFLQPKSDC